MPHRKSARKPVVTNGENISRRNMSPIEKEENDDSACTQEDFSDENRDHDAVSNKNSGRKKRKAPKRVAVKRQKRGKPVKRKTPATVKEESGHETDKNSEVDSDSSIKRNLTRNDPVYTCKLCQKDFSSSFILCLHLQIHEKVGSIPVIEDDDTSENLSASHIEEEEVEVETIHVKVEECEEESNNISNVCMTEIKEESSDSNAAPVNQILNKNFVESLKKNLSLAMNRKL